jgi:hypothetical protein
MRSQRTRPRLRPSCLERLEDRSLLNGSLPSSPNAQIHIEKSSRPTLVVATLSGQYGNGFSSPDGLGITFSTSGPAKGLGQMTFTGTEVLRKTISPRRFVISNGTGTLTGADGRQLVLQFNGFEHFTGKREVFTLQGSVKSGIGVVGIMTDSVSGSGNSLGSALKIQLKLKLTL